MADPGETNWDGRNDEVGPWAGPKSGNEQAKTQQAIYTAVMSRAALRRIPPPLPQIIPNPRRFGYTQRTIGISDILNVNRDYTPRIDWSGGIGSYSATSRNALGAI